MPPVLPCMDCRAPVELHEQTLGLAAWGNAVLHQQREPELARDEVVRCASCQQRWREERGTAMVADLYFARDVLRDVEDGLAAGKELHVVYPAERRERIARTDWSRYVEEHVALLAQDARQKKRRRGGKDATQGKLL